MKKISDYGELEVKRKEVLVTEPREVSPALYYFCLYWTIFTLVIGLVVAVFCIFYGLNFYNDYISPGIQWLNNHSEQINNFYQNSTWN